MEIGRTLTVTRRAQWRAWLRKHHATSREIWLVFHKKNSGKPRLPYNDAVEEALCFGWIDSIIKGIDERKFAQRFTPRKPGSPWSAMNKERVRRLIRARRMTRAGLDAYRRGNRTSVRSESIFPHDILQAIRSDAVVWNRFRRFPSSYKRIRIGWIEGARKRPAVFRQRLAFFLKMTREGKRFGMVQ